MRRVVGVAIILLLVLFVPFLGKPFHIDDSNFISIAKGLALPGVSRGYQSM